MEEPGDPSHDTLPLASAAIPTVSGTEEHSGRLAPNVPKRLGPYELLDLLGHGGQGLVFRARHEKLGSGFAVKVLIAGEHASREAILRFRREATTVARMGKHPNIVTIHDLGEEGSLAYYAMELIEGKPLGTILREGPVAPREAARLVEKVARALHFAHTHGVIHRDIKPGNILVRTDGEPQVMDFGLARDVTSEQGLSHAGQIMGTAAYMAPEQACGEPENTDAQTDVYNLGAVLYEMLAGIPPHPAGALVEVLPHILAGEVIPPRKVRASIPVDLETVCLKCLRSKKSDRYATAEDLAEDLARWLRGEAVKARPASLARKASDLLKRHKVATMGVAASLATLVAIGCVWYFTPGTLLIEVFPSNASVRIGDRPWSASEGVPRVRLSAGGYAVRVESPGYEPFQGDVVVERGGTKELRVALGHEKGTIEATCEPLGAEIEVDGVAYGSRIRHLSLDTGRHHLRAWSPEHFVQERDVEVRRGETAQASFWLDEGDVWMQEGPQIEYPRAELVPDVDGDGLPEIDSAELTNWVIRSAKDGSAICALPKAPGLWHGFADLGGKVGRVLLLSQRQGTDLTVYCLDLSRKGDDKTVWEWKGTDRGPADGSEHAVHTVRDLTRDDIAELAIAGGDGVVHLLEGRTGEEMRHFALPAGARLFAQSRLDLLLSRDRQGAIDSILLPEGKPAWPRYVASNGPAECVDFDHDGEPEVLVLTEDTWTVIETQTGTVRWKGAHPQEAVHEFRLADLGGGVLDLLLLGPSGHVQAIDVQRGRTIWEVPSGIVSLSPGVLVPGDEVVFRTADALIAFGARDGARRWSYPAGELTTCIAGDWDGDGRLEIFSGLVGGGLLCLDDAGRELWRLHSDRAYSPRMLLPDVDGDGLSEVVVSAGAAFLGVVRGPRVLWAKKAPKPLQATPIIADVDGDGRPEVIELGPWKEGSLLCLDGETGAVGWARSEAATPNRAPAVGDWDGDGRPDIAMPLMGGAAAMVFQGSDGKPIATLGEGSGDQSYSTPAIADLDRDGVMDLILPLWNEKVLALCGKTRAVLWTHATKGKNMGGVALSDLDGDGLPDVVLPSTDGIVYALRGTDGKVIWQAEVGQPGSRCPARIEDLNGDGGKQVLLVADAGQFWVLDGKNGSLVWKTDAGEGVWGHAAVGRLEGKGTVIVVPCGDKGVSGIAWKERRLLWSHADLHTLASPVVADIDRDGLQEVVIGTAEGELVVLDLGTGKRLWSMKASSQAIEADPAVADLDGDGILDIVIADHSGTLQAVSGRGTLGARRRR